MTTENQTPEIPENNSQQASVSPKNNKKGIVVAVAAAVVIVGGIAIGSSADGKAEEKVAEFVKQVEADENMKISYGSVDAAIASSSIGISDVKFSQKDGSEVFNIDEMSIQAKGYVEKEQIPYLGSISLEGLKIVDQRVLSELEAETGIDYSDKDFDINFGYDFDAKKDTMNAKFSIGVSDLNSIDFSTNISGVEDSWNAMQSAYKENKGDFEFTRAQATKIENGLQNASFNDLTLSYVNKGEIEKLIEHASKENGITVEQFKQQAPMAVDHYLGNTELSAEFKKFIANPEKLTISIKPDAPIKFKEAPALMMAGMMGQVDAVMTKLNIKLEAN